MNWKLFTTACATALLASLPQNGITCAGDEPDETDYFTSFFSRPAATDDGTLQPFFYTQLSQFYRYDETIPTNAALKTGTSEWMQELRSTDSNAVEALVFHSSDSVLRLLQQATPNDGASLPAALRNNAVARRAVQEHNSALLSYLRLAQRTNGYAKTSDWEAPTRDSGALMRLHKEASTGWNVSTAPFLRERYAYLRCKTAFYAGNHAACIRAYNEGFGTKTGTSVQPMAQSYAAGSLFRTGRHKEAAYAFSQVFAASPAMRREAYRSFTWCSNGADSSLRETYTAQARNDRERANFLGLFALYGESPQVHLLPRIYALDPASPLVPLIVSREISKVEEQYLSPSLHWPKSTLPSFGYAWEYSEDERKKFAGTQAAGRALAAFLSRPAANSKLPNRAFYAAGAAYLHLIDKKWDAARSALAQARSLSPSARVNDQLQLLQLLLVTQEPKQLGAAEEAALLPAAKWLTEKAKTDREYAPFCRNFFSEVLALRYKKAGNAPRTALSLGVADLKFFANDVRNVYYGWSNGLDYVHYQLAAADVQQLYGTMAKPATPWERFLVTHASFDADAVTETAGTAYLREGQYAAAVEWLSKARKLEPLTHDLYTDEKNWKADPDPFHDYLGDRQRYLKAAPGPYTKLDLARQLLELQQRIEKEPAPDAKAKLYYRWASALYNMSYYGNSWNAVAYDRTGADWNEGGYKLAWQKEYYGVHKAKELYEKAYALTADREFKAACLFLVAKCRQRQFVRPDYRAPEGAEKAFEQAFRESPYFARYIREFGDTKFYKYSYNRCSYLRDFVKKQQQPKAPVKK